MGLLYDKVSLGDTQVSYGLYESLQAIWDVLPSENILARLAAYRWTGRRGHNLQALWRAYVASFILNLPHTNALIRQLEDDNRLRLVCGFGDSLPSRWTFNRFIQRLSFHADLVDQCFQTVTDRVARLLPGFGEKVAVDSTTIRTHSNPNRKHVSDLEASWTAKNSAKAKEGGKEWHFGYKYHAVADAAYGLPIAGLLTTASRNDSPEMPKVLGKAMGAFDWFQPAYVIADRGYDGLPNHLYISKELGATPIIKLKRPSNAKLYEGIYTETGAPTCVGNIPMEYVRTDSEKGHLYRCSKNGCILKGRKGVHYCDDEIWVKPTDNLRVIGEVARDSQEWKDLYSFRQGIERVWKGCKESRRLERHCIRGLRMIGLHAIMSVLAFQATALVHVLAGEVEDMRWMVRKVD